MTISEMYNVIGGDFQKIMGLFGGSEAMVKKFCIKFTQDSSYENLCKYVAEGNTVEAFRMAHTLKGICQNLCFDRLGASSIKITESLRNAENTEAAKLLLPEVTADYELTANTIKEVLC